MRRVAIMTVDPGGTTGVAWGLYDVEGESVGDILSGGLMTGCGQVTGSEEWQASHICELWRDFEMFARIKHDCNEHVLVFEDFVLRVGSGSSDRVGLAPVRITSLVYGMLLARHVGTVAPLGEGGWELSRAADMIPWKLQQVSAAKSFATKDRLTRWGLWKPGMQHARDAWRHVALCIAEYEKWAESVGRYGPNR